MKTLKLEFQTGFPGQKRVAAFTLLGKEPVQCGPSWEGEQRKPDHLISYALVTPVHLFMIISKNK